MYLKTGEMELRGVVEKVSKKTGKTYRVANMEEYKTGEHVEVYLGDEHNTLLDGNKGDLFNLIFLRNKYGSLDLVQVIKLNEQ